MLKHTLQLNPDYEVRVFDKAHDLLKHMHLKPHVVTIDYNLPEMPFILMNITYPPSQSENHLKE